MIGLGSVRVRVRVRFMVKFRVRDIVLFRLRVRFRVRVSFWVGVMVRFRVNLWVKYNPNRDPNLTLIFDYMHSYSKIFNRISQKFIKHTEQVEASSF